VRTVALVLLLAFTRPALGANEVSSDDQRQAPTYESPVLSLLFLPVNLLIKMASVFGPEDSAKASANSDSTTK